MGDFSSSYPVWAADESLVYRDCNTITAPTDCGIYTANLQDIQASNSNVTPVQLVEDATAIPSDAQGELIAYTSRQDGNWEAYMMSLDGTNIRNLSDNSTSNDGLPTISSDGKWVAFVSDRSGEWAVWIVPVTGGSSRKLFNLPAWIPWGNDDMAWINERISWGP